VIPIPLDVAPAGPWYAWHTHLDVITLCVGLLVAYWYAVTVWRPHIADAGRVQRRQVALYCTGVAVVFLAAGTPVHDIGEHYLLSVHMTEHLLLSLVAPPLLLAGVPTWLWEALFVRKGVLPVMRVVLNPVVTLAFFNAVLVGEHLPESMNLILNHHWVHFFAHVLLVSSALMMWWPVIADVPGLPHLTYPFRMMYLFLQSLVPSVVAAFLTFATGSLYSFYAAAPRIEGISIVTDQQLGALVMKLFGSLILWGFIGVSFFKWYAREQAEDKGPAIADVEEELREIGLTLSDRSPRHR
jgi:cytochrome c oxidase assembly factor CtaG